MNSILKTLRNPNAIEAAEDIVDQIQGQIALSRAKDKKGPSIAGRVKDQQTIPMTAPGLAYSREEDSVRKFFVSTGNGECDVEFYNSKTDYERNKAPFSSYHIVAPFSDKLFFTKNHPRRIYARVTTTKAPQTVYVHMEWFG